MPYFSRCPVPRRDGSDCWQAPHPGSEFGVCEPHWRRIVDGWFGEQPSVTIRCFNCSSLAYVDPIELDFARCDRCSFPIGDSEHVATLVALANEEAEKKRAESGIVYYIRFSDRVKIGFTTSLRSRLLALPVDEVLAAEPGTYDLETERHRQFAQDLAAGREWFNLSDALRAHVTSVREKHGDPFAVGQVQ